MRPTPVLFKVFMPCLKGFVLDVELCGHCRGLIGGLRVDSSKVGVSVELELYGLHPGRKTRRSPAPNT